MITKITLEILAGTNLNNAIITAKNLIKEYDTTVEFEFNSVKMLLSTAALQYTDNEIYVMYAEELVKIRKVEL